MKNIGIHNAKNGIDSFGLKNVNTVYWNLTAAPLYEESLRRGEAQLAAGGVLVADTGQHTGRSPKDKFTVRDATTENTVWWDNNPAMTKEAFDQLHADMLKAAEGKDLFVQDLYGCADPGNRIKVRVITEYAWHSLFIRTMLRRPEVSELADFVRK